MRAPTVAKYCKRCNLKSEFISTNLFRINAQQKKLDIWLIYKCRFCDTTWNFTVLSRINPKSISGGILERYTSNDTDLALKHATDAALIKHNGASCSIADVEIKGDDYILCEPAEIHLTSKWTLENKISSLIRQKLNLSGNQFGKMCDDGKIICLSSHSLNKSKMSGTVILQIKP